MKELSIALLIVAAVFVVSFVAGPTGFATYKFDKLTVSGGHALLTQTFSPNGDGVADVVYASASGKCASGKGSGIGIYDSSGTLLASRTGFVCIATSCEYSGTLPWNGRDPTSGKAYSDGTYTVRSGCWPNGNPSAISNDKTVTITLKSKLYPAKSTYTNGVVCGSKPTCKGSKTLNMMSGCAKTSTQNAGNRCSGKDDTCVKSDTGSCRFDGVKCLYDSNYCCKAVDGVGVCQATAVAAVPGGK